jgi:D-alanyl-D-alanine carboxypeptidase/D-alanyl-D-alanine-endopeptidase (penicillin-binding protein 4)
VATLFQLKNEISEDRLFRLLPESGKTGTIRKMKPLQPSSSFWAKSGSFGNTYNLAGYYKNAQGKMYVFSIMGNLGNRPTVAIKQDVMAILNALR